MKVKVVRLGSVLAQDGRSVSVDAAATYRFAGILNRGRGLFDKGELAGTDTSYKSLSQLVSGQVVYSKLFGWEGSVTAVPEAFDGHFVSSEFPHFDVDSESASTTYLDHYLKSPAFAALIAKSGTGLGQRRQRVSVDTFLALPVPLPSRADQDRITAHLDAISHTLVSQGAPCTPTDVVEVAVRKAAGHATTRRLGSLLERNRKWIDIDPDMVYRPIGIRGFGRGMIRYPETPAGNLSKLRYFRLVPGDLLVSNIKAWEGAVTIVGSDDQDRIGSNRFLQYRTKTTEASASWIALYLLTSEGTARLGAASPGSADRNRTLSMESFEAIDVPVPEPALQAKVTSIAARARAIAEVQSRRDRLSQAILTAARNEIFNSLS